MSLGQRYRKALCLSLRLQGRGQRGYVRGPGLNPLVHFWHQVPPWSSLSEGQVQTPGPAL